MSVTSVRQGQSLLSATKDQSRLPAGSVPEIRAAGHIFEREEDSAHPVFPSLEISIEGKQNTELKASCISLLPSLRIPQSITLQCFHIKVCFF